MSAEFTTKEYLSLHVFQDKQAVYEDFSGRRGVLGNWKRINDDGFGHISYRLYYVTAAGAFAGFTMPHQINRRKARDNRAMGEHWNTAMIFEPEAKSIEIDTQIKKACQTRDNEIPSGTYIYAWRDNNRKRIKVGYGNKPYKRMVKYAERWGVPITAESMLGVEQVGDREGREAESIAHRLICSPRFGGSWAEGQAEEFFYVTDTSACAALKMAAAVSRREIPFPTADKPHFDPSILKRALAKVRGIKDVEFKDELDLEVQAEKLRYEIKLKKKNGFLGFLYQKPRLESKVEIEQRLVNSLMYEVEPSRIKEWVQAETYNLRLTADLLLD